MLTTATPHNDMDLLEDSKHFNTNTPALTRATHRSDPDIGLEETLSSQCSMLPNDLPVRSYKVHCLILEFPSFNRELTDITGNTYSQSECCTILRKYTSLLGFLELARFNRRNVRIYH